MAENLYRLKHPALIEKVVPRAKQIAAAWLQEHQELAVDIWAPHPDNAVGTKTDFNGRIIRHSERHVHAVGYHPAPEKPGRRREEFPDRLELIFPGEKPKSIYSIEAPALILLNENEQQALGELAQALMDDRIISPEIWHPETSRGVTQLVRLPQHTQPAETLAILYKLFPKR